MGGTVLDFGLRAVKFLCRPFSFPSIRNPQSEIRNRDDLLLQRDLIATLPIGKFETCPRCEAYPDHMANNLMLRNTSLLLMLLLTLHVVDDVVHGFDSAGLLNMIGIVVLGFLIYGTLVLHERVSGHIVMLFVALFSTLMPVVHLRSARINETAQASGGFFFIWTLWALGAVGIFGMILAIQGLLNLRRSKSRNLENA